MKRPKHYLHLLTIVNFIFISFFGYYIFYSSPSVEFVFFDHEDLVPINTLLNGQGYVNAVYTLGRPSVDSDWKSTEIFENHNFAIVGAVFQKNDGALGFVKHALTKSNCSSVTVCIRLAKKGFSSESCSRIFCAEKPSRNFEKLNNSEITHVFIENIVNITQSPLSLLISQIFPISPSKDYFFCYGLPKNAINASYPLITNCPPCLCSSVFASHVLSSKLSLISDKSLDRVNYNDNVNLLANKLLKHSRFTPCLQMKNESVNHQEPSDVFLVGDSANLTAFSAWAVRQLYERNGMQLVLEGGTLLGWYRNCSVIRDDVDVDFSVPSWSLNHGFYEEIVKLAYTAKRPMVASFFNPAKNRSVELKTSRIFGDLDYGVEVRFDVKAPGDPDIGIDIFVLFINEPGVDYNYIQGFVTWQRWILHYAMPRNLTICSTIFLGGLYLVPCEPEHYLFSHYGNGWSTPVPRADGYWYSQPNIVKKIKLTEYEWASRKMFASF